MTLSPSCSIKKSNVNETENNSGELTDKYRLKPSNCRILYGHYLPTVILIIIRSLSQLYYITHSLFHSRLKTFLFYKSFPTAAFPFSSSGFTTWIPQTVYCHFLAYQSFTFQFLIFTLFSFGSVPQIKLTHVGFRAHVKRKHVKIASRIVSYRNEFRCQVIGKHSKSTCLLDN